MLCTLIVPVYNAEEYLSECLDSIFKQVDDTLEIIIVNDGSTDGSLEIIKTYRNHYKFKIINQPNGGISKARNTGIENAEGDYILFLDSDDVWLDNIYELVKSIIIRSGPDCISFNYEELRLDGSNRKIILNNSDRSAMDKKQLSKEKIEIAKQNHWYLWRFVIKRKYFSQNKFDVHRRFEDQLLLPKLIHEVETIEASKQSILKYRQNENSITRNLRVSDLDDSMYGIKKYLNEFFSSRSKYWGVISSNLFISHVSKCARLSYGNKAVASDYHSRAVSIFPWSVFIYTVNYKAVLYKLAPRTFYSRLINRVKCEVLNERN
ncbi:glycosyltransferase family 2 protein [Vibrio breoganii]